MGVGADKLGVSRTRRGDGVLAAFGIPRARDLSR